FKCGWTERRNFHMLLYLPVLPFYGIGFLPFYAAYCDVWPEPNFPGAILWICVALSIFVLAASFSVFMPLLAEIIYNPRLAPIKKLELCGETFGSILDIFDHSIKSTRSLSHLSDSNSRRRNHVNRKKKPKNEKN